MFRLRREGLAPPFFFTNSSPISIVAQVKKYGSPKRTMFHWNCKFTSLGKILFITLGSALLLSSCSSVKTTPVKETEEPISVITGKPGGLKIADFGKKDQPSDGLPINALLWRAALDIASFVPLDDVDTFGGSIVTEWHQSEGSNDERLS